MISTTLSFQVRYHFHTHLPSIRSRGGEGNDCLFLSYRKSLRFSSRLRRRFSFAGQSLYQIPLPTRQREEEGDSESREGTRIVGEGILLQDRGCTSRERVRRALGKRGFVTISLAIHSRSELRLGLCRHPRRLHPARGTEDDTALNLPCSSL